MTDTDNTTPTNADLAEALRSVAMLASLSISKWKGEQTDHDASERMKRAEGASGDAAKVIKKILAGADTELRALGSTLDAARSAHYALTLPWGGDTSARGPRLLPNELFERYVQTMGQYKQEMIERLDALVAAYPDCVARAKAKLGNLAKDEDYPTEAEIRRRFALSFDWNPIPDSQGFKGLPPNWQRVLGVKIGERVKRMADDAMKAAWGTARERLEHAKTRLEDEEGKFRRSTIDKLNELPGLMAAFNIMKDERMTEFSDWLKERFGEWDADMLRENAGERRRFVRVCTEGVAMLDGWGV